MRNIDRNIKQRANAMNFAAVTILFLFLTLIKAISAPVFFQDPPGYPALWPLILEMRPYTRLGQPQSDLSGANDRSANSSPTQSTDFSSGPSFDQPSFYYYGNGSILFFRLRVNGPPISLTGSGQPFDSATWNILIDIDGDGWKEFVIELDGTSSGLMPDDIVVIYDNSNSQKFNIGAANVWRQDCARHTNNTSMATVDGEPQSSAYWDSDPDPYVWDFGRTRVVQIDRTKNPGSQNSEYFIDIQIPIDVLDATALGGPKLTSKSIFSFAATTSNSNTDPTQKDILYAGDFTMGDAPFPFGDPTNPDSQTIQNPVILSVTTTPCPAPITLSANVLDVTAVINNVVTTTVATVSFEYYLDLNNDNIANDNSTWTFIANATQTPTLGRWTATWNSTNLPQARYLIRARATDYQNNITYSTDQPYLYPSNIFAVFTNSCGSPVADVVVYKSGPTNVYAGANVTYSLTVSNSGPSTSIGIILADQLPTNFVFINATGGGVLTNNLIIWQPFSLPSSQATNFFIAAKAIYSGVTTNIAYSVAQTYDLYPANNNGSSDFSRVITTINPAADIKVIKTGNMLVGPGTSMVYSITITNLGPSTASNIIVNDTLPTNVIYVSSSPPGGLTNNIITWGPIPSLPYTGTTNFTITVIPKNPGAMTNTASATSSTYDTDQSNNNGSADHSRVITVVAAPGQASTLSGYVYLDSNRNALKDSNESGTTLNLFVKIIPSTNTAGPALLAAPVNPSTGFYSISNVTQGIYNLIVDDNNFTNDVTPTIPAGWSGTEMPDQIRKNVSVYGVNLNNLNFGLINAVSINGIVFKDTGDGGGTANDGILNGGETGIPNLEVKLTDSTGGVIYDTIKTDGAGRFTLLIPNSVPAGAQLVVRETNPQGYISINGTVGNSGGTYSRIQDTITFNYTSGMTYTNLYFADAPLSKLEADNQQTVLPGQTAYYIHQFIAGSAGFVNFVISQQPTPSLPGWTQVIFKDDNCNNVVDSSETVITSPIYLAAGQTICIIVRDFVPITAPPNANNRITVSALFTYAGTSPLITTTNSRTDITVAGTPSNAGLVLIKEVDKATALPGDLLSYTIKYSNNSQAAITNIVIYDSTPNYTVFVSATNSVPPPNISNIVITHPVPGAVGQIKWILTGELLPGSSGNVYYKVKIAQ
ncbi:MAG: hypothetical protein ACP5T0_04745 [Verrucomicrobiia bacterium]